MSEVFCTAGPDAEGAAAPADSTQPAAQSAATREAPRLESQLAALDKLASAYNSGRAAAAEAVAAGAALKNVRCFGEFPHRSHSLPGADLDIYSDCRAHCHDTLGASWPVTKRQLSALAGLLPHIRSTS